MRVIIATPPRALVRDVDRAVQASPWAGQIETVIADHQKPAAAWARTNGIALRFHWPESKRFGVTRALAINHTQMAADATHLIALWDGENQAVENVIDTAHWNDLVTFIFRTDLR